MYKRMSQAALLAGLWLGLVGNGWAGVTTGAALPEVRIAKPGKLLLKSDDKVSYQAFSSNSLQGKVTSIHVVAGRIGIDEINAHYVDALTAAKPDGTRFQSVSIVDQDQALWGTGGIVESKTADKQREFPSTVFVIDGEGTARSTWGLSKKNYAVIILDADGKVLRFKDGKLSAAEVEDFVAAVLEATQR